MGYEMPALTNAQRAELLERLIGFRKDIQNAREADMHTEADESDDLVARITLAVLTAEPVAVKYASGEVLTKEECADDERVFAVCCRVETPLFTAPPVLALQLSDAFLSCVAHLDAAISLLEKGGRKGAASNKMFDMMIEDYKKALLTARAAIRAAGYEVSE